jgi:hypothetical protein
MPFLKNRPGAIWAIAFLVIASLICVEGRTWWAKKGGLPINTANVRAVGTGIDAPLRASTQVAALQVLHRR